MIKPAKQDLPPNSKSQADSVDQEERLSPKGVIVMLSIVIAFCLLFAIPRVMDMLIDEPLPDLVQMEKRSGIITSVFKARIGRTNNYFFTIQTNDGESVRYLSHMALQDQFERLKGQQVTVWSVPVKLGWGWWSYENKIMQVQYQDQLILDYENEYRERIELNRGKSGNFLNITALIFILGIIIIPSIWMITIAIRKMRDAEKGVGNGES